jgi:hypothetical protein
MDKCTIDAPTHPRHGKTGEVIERKAVGDGHVLVKFDNDGHCEWLEAAAVMPATVPTQAAPATAAVGDPTDPTPPLRRQPL